MSPEENWRNRTTVDWIDQLYDDDIESVEISELTWKGEDQVKTIVPLMILNYGGGSIWITKPDMINLAKSIGVNAKDFNAPID